MHTATDWQPYIVALFSALVGALMGFSFRYVYDVYVSRSKLEVNSTILGPTIQSGISYYRLLITNNGHWRAKSVNAVVEEIKTDDTPKKNYLPSPLPWTHQRSPQTVRDIQRRQPVYLDLIEYKLENKSHILRLLSDEIKDLPNLSRFENGLKELKIGLYQQSGQVINIRLSFEWDGINEPEKFVVIQENTS